MTGERVHGRLLQEAQLNLTLKKLVEPEAKIQTQKDIIEYVEKTLEIIKINRCISK